MPNFVNVPGLPGVYYDYGRRQYLRRNPMAAPSVYTGPLPAGFTPPGGAPQPQQPIVTPPPSDQGFTQQPQPQPGGLLPQNPPPGSHPQAPQIDYGTPDPQALDRVRQALRQVFTLDPAARTQAPYSQALNTVIGLTAQAQAIGVNTPQELVARLRANPQNAMAADLLEGLMAAFPQARDFPTLNFLAQESAKALIPGNQSPIFGPLGTPQPTLPSSQPPAPAPAAGQNGLIPPNPGDIPVPQIALPAIPPPPPIAPYASESLPQLPPVNVPQDPLAQASTQGIQQRIAQLQGILASGGTTSPVYQAQAGLLADQYQQSLRRASEGLARTGLTGSGLAFDIANQVQREREKGLQTAAAQEFQRAGEQIQNLFGLTEQARLDQRQLAVRSKLAQLELATNVLNNREKIRSTRDIAQLNAQTQYQMEAMRQQLAAQRANLEAQTNTLLAQIAQGGATERTRMQLENALERVRLAGKIDKDIAKTQANNEMWSQLAQLAGGLFGPQIAGWASNLLFGQGGQGGLFNSVVQPLIGRAIDQFGDWTTDAASWVLDQIGLGDLFGGGGGGDLIPGSAATAEFV